MIRKLILLPLVLAALLGVTLAVIDSAQTPAGGCVAEVRLAADGTWAPGRLVADGETVRSVWSVEREGWRPGHAGSECRIVQTGPTRIPGAALFEDGSYAAGNYR